MNKCGHRKGSCLELASELIRREKQQLCLPLRTEVESALTRFHQPGRPV
jgi:hypothetical protein